MQRAALMRESIHRPDMKQFDKIADLLNWRFVGVFSCNPGKTGLANGLKIQCSGRSGFAFVFEPSRDGSMLLSLHEEDIDDEDDGAEVWATGSVEEVIERLQPWAFPPSRTLPPSTDRSEERRRLEQLALGLTARQGVPCVTVEPAAGRLRLLTSAGRKEFERDWKSLNLERILLHFPWDPAGRLELETTVLLNAYETTKPPRRDRNLCLAAIGPKRRRDEQRINIELVDLIMVNQSHRWERCPWLWQEAAMPASELWGSERIQVSPSNDARRSSRAAARSSPAPVARTPESELASRSLQLLEDGDVEGALSLYGIHLSPDLHRLLGGERIKPPACCAHPDAAWTKLLVETLRQSAPWKLPGAIVDEAERLRTWAAQKKGRKRQVPMLKLVIFPGQHHQRKASLMLTGDEAGGNPRLVIEATASNARLADTAWKRPLVVDFLRNSLDCPTPPTRRVCSTRVPR